MNLVIVESPAKAKTINKYLGDNYTVLASYGHIRDLPSKNGSVDPDQNFKMEWEVDNFSKKYLKDISFENLSNTTGLHLTLTSCFLIVASDIGSYFVGKSFGKKSLSPISPSKTIEGLIGGISCSILLAIFFAFLMNWENPLFVGILYGILISLMALVGDLIESMMKRDAKIKDSGTFLPGHGGILDRIDSYIFTPSI